MRGLSCFKDEDRLYGVALTEGEGELLSEAHHNRSGPSGGNGSLMRTAPVALAYLSDSSGLTEAATRIVKPTTNSDFENVLKTISKPVFK